MPNGSSPFTADCEEPALDIHARSRGLWTAHSVAKENHEEERAESKNSQMLTTTSIPFVQFGAGLWKVRGIWTEGVELTLRKETGKMIF